MSTALLATVYRQVLNGLNSAGWLILVDGVISASTLVCASGAFLASDIGKRIAIDGAGAGGTIYEGTITGYTSVTQVTVTPAVSVGVSGASVSYGGRLRDARRNLVEIREGIFEADELYYTTFAETVGHWARPDILSLSAAINHGQQVPEHIGELGQPLIQIYTDGPFEPMKDAEYQEIMRYRANTGVSPLDTYGSLAHNVIGSQIGGYGRISEDGEYVALSGTAMKVPVVPAYSRGADLKSPLIATTGLVSCSLARLMPKEGAGASLNLIQIHQSFHNATIEAIKANKKPLPTLEMAEAQPERKAA